MDSIRGQKIKSIEATANNYSVFQTFNFIILPSSIAALDCAVAMKKRLNNTVI